MANHGIKAVSNRTGLSAHVLRVWEKRYEAVSPQRTDTNRRLYTDADIERLQQLVTLTRAGHPIGQIASLTKKEIKELLASAGNIIPIAPATEGQQSAATIEQCLAAVRTFDQTTLEAILDTAIRDLGYSGLISQVLVPFIQRIGTEWHQGNITSADEHAATSFIKDYLTLRVSSYAPMANAPVIIVCTPTGQLHELGAFIASCLARKLGWRVIYLGASLPADAIAGAAVRANATAVLLSIIYPADDSTLNQELELLRKQLPDNTSILVGGDGTISYEDTLKKIKATVVDTIPKLEEHLQALRK